MRGYRQMRIMQVVAAASLLFALSAPTQLLNVGVSVYSHIPFPGVSVHVTVPPEGAPHDPTSVVSTLVFALYRFSV